MAEEGQGLPEGGSPLAETPRFEDWYNAQPQALREEYERRLMSAAYQQFNDGLATEYGDLLPLVIDAKSDPELRKKLGRLKDGKVRDLFAAALDTFDRAAPPADANPLAERVQSVETKLAEDEQRRQWDAYNAARDREALALQNEFPQLRGNAKLTQHIREIAEARTMQNLRNGKAQAIPYKDVFDEWQSLAKAEPPPSAPQTTQAGPPDRPQAPRTAQEGRERALTLLRNAGGLSRLQQSIEARVQR